MDVNNVYLAGSAPIANGGDNDSYTYVDANRATQGQTFTTIAGDTGYVLTDVWVKHAGYAANNANTYWMMAAGGNLTLRIIKPAQVGTSSFVLRSETYVTTGTEGWSTAGTNSVNGDSKWLHFKLASPVTLAAGTTYGFDLTSANNNTFFEWLGTATNVLNGGVACKGTAIATPDNTMTALVGDRVFLVALAPLVCPPISARPVAGNQLEIAWAAANTASQLETSTLLTTGSWTSLGLPAIVLSGGNNYVTVPMTKEKEFFRLAMPSNNYQIQLAGDSLALSQGSAGSMDFSVSSLGAYSGNVALSASNVPAGVTIAFDPTSLNTGTSVLTVNAAPTVPPGTYAINIIGTSGSLTSSTTLNLTIGSALTGYYTWPAYSPSIAYDYVDEFGIVNPPTQVMDDITGVAGTYTSGWWCFRYGSNMNSLVTSNAWIPMLERFNADFAYITDILRWPREPRARSGYYSSIYLFGSSLSTDTASNTATGGWQSGTTYKGKSWPMVLASYYPVYAFDPACSWKNDGSQGAMIHEGIHCILAGMPGCRNAAWTGESGNTWLQGAMESQRTGDFSSMGWLSAGAAITPFMPIECYSGWLQDGSFGGPSAEGVNRYDANGKQLCTWRNLLGGTQYGECFMHNMDAILGPKSIAWAYRNCNRSGRLLQDLAEQTGGLGPVKTRRLIQEFRVRAAMCDFGRWSYAYKKLLLNNWNLSIHAEYAPIWIDCAQWNATCYVATTNTDGTLYPEERTLPAWSGANQIPLTVSGSSASVTFNPIGANMVCQLVYRDTSGNIRYSNPVSSGVCSIPLVNVLNNVVIAVVCNTDYIYNGESSRTNKFNYTLTLGAGITGKANIYTKWFDYNPPNYKITAFTTGPGTISPAGVNTVTAGASKTFTITPNPGYTIVNVLASGVPVGPVSSYTFKNLRGSTTIEARFGIKTYNIWGYSSGVGTISPLGLAAVTAGASQTYTVTPNAGWSVYSLAVDGVDQGAVTSYTSTNVQADHNIKVKYVGSNPAIPQLANLLFACSSETLPASGETGDWDAYYPAGLTVAAVQFPTVEIINNVKWEKNLRANNDGYNVGTYVSPIPCSGATIVVAVKPVSNVTSDPWNSIVDCFYNNLGLMMKNSTGQLQVWRNGIISNTGVIIPDGQRTVLSLVVQSTGAFKLFANGVEKYSTTTSSPFTQLAPGTLSYMKDITIGRNSPDGWSTFNGNIGDVYLYKVALSNTERTALENVIRTKFGF